MTGAARPDPHPKGIQFSGAFEPPEREYLASQFSHCHFDLIRRSERDPSCAVVSWSAAAALQQGARQGPGPLRGLPSSALYVLHGGEEPSLVRVSTRDDLAREFGEPLENVPLPDLDSPNQTWETVKSALRGLLPFRPR